MKNTKLYIAVNGDYWELDITDIDILLQFEEVNIRSFESLKAEHSKTIVLSGTPTNNDILGYLYDITTSSSFDVLKAAPCYIESENNILFEGSFKLVNATVNPNGVKEYECVLTAKTLDFFDDLKTLRLKDIDLSDFSHTLTKTNVENSWATSIRYQNTTVPFELGFGYVYPLEFRGVNDIGYLWSPKDMSPAIYLKTLIDRGLAQLGYNCKSEFFNSEDFKRLIMPNVYQRVPLTDGEIQCSNFEASSYTDSQSILTVTGSSDIKIPFGLTATNILNPPTVTQSCTRINATSGIFTAARPSEHEIKVSGVLTATMTSTNFGDRFFVTGFPTGGNFTPSTITDAKIAVSLQLVNLNTNTVLQQIQQEITISDGVEYTVDNYSLTFNINATFNQILATGTNYVVRLAFTATTQIYFVTRVFPFYLMETGELDLDYAVSEYTLSLKDFYAAETDTIKLNQCLNNTTTLFDIFKDIGKLFNLRYEFENDGRTINIEPATTYYNNGQIKDWSKKIDDNQPILIETISDLDYDKIKFHYIEDGDYHNQYTVDTYDAYYGEQNIEIDNDWSSEERVIKTETIASTPNVDYIGDISLPYYVTYEGGNYKPMSEIKPRILIYGGLVQSSSNWCWISKLIPYTSTNIIANFRTTYPFAGHINTPYNQTWDINFGTRPAYYWGYNTITDNNLYNRFYKQFIDSEINTDTKILTAYFNLTDEDIYKFKYNDKIFIDNTYYRVNKIIDYNPIKSELTKVELVKVIDVDVFIPNGRIIRPNDWINNDVVPDTRGGGAIPVGDISKPTGGTNNAFARVVNGYQNVVSENSFNVLINGNNNLVQANSLNVSITGDNNQVLNGASNVVIIGSGITITESNTSYIEGVGYIQNGVVTPQDFNVLDGGEDEVQNPFSVTTLNIVDGMEDSVQQVNYDFNINIIQ